MTAEPSLDRARSLIRAGLTEARAALNAIGDPQLALTTAREFLAETLREVRMALTDARAEQAARIVDEEGMAMAVLGRKLGGISRQAVHKEVKRGRQARQKDEEASA
jgi:predicted DNA-binding protein (UPF0251 family)